jgi:hypothetical protein
MREFVFTLEYEPRSDPVQDAFIEHPELIGQSLECSVTTESMWRLDRFGGPESALERLDETLFVDHHCEECIGHQHCHGPFEYETVAETPAAKTVYTHRPEFESCHSIPYVAANQLGDGLFFETLRRENRYRWHVLLRDEHAVSQVVDALQSDLDEGISLRFEHINRPTRWKEQFVTAADLPPEQRVALETAVERGYYSTPRETTAESIADDLDVPQSTFQYRLQRAESWLATQFVAESKFRS